MPSFTTPEDDARRAEMKSDCHGRGEWISAARSAGCVSPDRRKRDVKRFQRSRERRQVEEEAVEAVEAIVTFERDRRRRGKSERERTIFTRPRARLIMQVPRTSALSIGPAPRRPRCRAGASRRRRRRRRACTISRDDVATRPFFGALSSARGHVPPARPEVKGRVRRRISN